MGFRVWQDLGVDARVEDSARDVGRECWIEGAGFRVQGPGFRVQGAGFRVQGVGFEFRVGV